MYNLTLEGSKFTKLKRYIQQTQKIHTVFPERQKLLAAYLPANPHKQNRLHG